MDSHRLLLDWEQELSMKILLTAINAKYIHSNLAVYSLKAYSEEYKEYIELAEYTINQTYDYILEGIYKAKPDVLCLSCYIWNIDYVLKVAKEFNRLCPTIPIWVGGPEVSYEAESFLKDNSWCTGIMVGEGEETFKELVHYYINNSCSSNTELSDLEEIKGLVLRKGETIISTGVRNPVDMDTLPFCYENIEDFENRIIYYESSRGCPFSCSYCLSSIDKRLRFRSVELVKRELQFFIDNKVPQVKFVDRTFNCKHDHAYAIWEYIKEHDNGITNFHFEISADLLNQKEIELIGSMRQGLIQLEIGVQSTNSDTIREIHRTMNLKELKETVTQIQKNGNIHEHLDLIAGLPYEDYESFARSFNDIYELKPNQLQLGFLKVLKGSYMYEHADEYGIVYHGMAPYEIMKSNWLSYDEILKLKQVEEMVEVYYNSGQYEMSIKLLEPLHVSAFNMFQSMGEFYEDKGYFCMSHGRLKRAEIIGEYVKDKFPEYEELFMEALTFDLYLRENCKTRPSWAPDISELKAMTREHCTNGKMSHIEPFHYRFPDKQTKNVTELPVRLDKAVWILFDYENRNKIDHQANISIIE